MAVLSIPTKISVAKISEYLAAQDVAQSGLFGQSINSRLPYMIYAERKAVEWLNFNNPNDDSLPATANYLMWLCGSYGLKAQQILNQGGSGTTLIIGSGVSVSLNVAPAADIDAIVGIDGNAPIAGANTWTLTDFVGYRVRFTLNDVVVYPKSYGNNIWFTKTTGSNTLTLNGPNNPTFQTNDFCHIEFYQALQDLNPVPIGAEQGGVITDESGNTYYVETS